MAHQSHPKRLMNLLKAKNGANSDTGLPVLPQLVPSSRCIRCDVCCRFPDADSPLRPYFTDKEISTAIDRGIDDRVFPDRSGCQVTVVPASGEEGFRCPAFDEGMGICRIYEHRPLDCQLYPLVLMWSDTYGEVVLGWDSKCPYMREELPDSIRNHGDAVKAMLRQPEVARLISSHPRLIGSHQKDVVQLEPLPELTTAFVDRWGKPILRRLQWEDLPAFRAALDRSGLRRPQTLAAISTASHMVWNGLLPYWWAETAGAFCLFIQSPDGWFMPLPPLSGENFEQSVSEAFKSMRRWNGKSAATRIENIPSALANRLQAMGYRLVSKDADYVYRAVDLARLAGDRYKSQRALCNRVDRMNVTVEPYRATDRSQCRALFSEWRRQKVTECCDRFAAMLLEDSISAHEAAWSHGPELELSGSVLRIDGRIRAYTFGYWLHERTWCVLLEVADRSIPGLAQFLFREVCRSASWQGAEFINTMDDSGLAGLRLSKEAYHPVMHLQNYVCTELACP